ncbi:hypothetical protein CLU79DRAFT_753765 [Phycomyces nitens]|nr:hypothetical protein CLU79DRAFT_753765 [Phycomyces nitens]
MAMYYYNALWIICVIILVFSIFIFIKRNRNAARARMAASTQRVAAPAYQQYPAPIYTPPDHTTININDQPNPYYGQPYPDSHRTAIPSSSATPPAYKPESTSVAVPPPSYQDYNKDPRLQGA